jgi:hypothetical protein
MGTKADVGSAAEIYGFKPQTLKIPNWSYVRADVSIHLATQSDYYRFHKMSELRVSIAVLAAEVASGSPSRTLPTRSGDNQAR